MNVRIVWFMKVREDLYVIDILADDSSTSLHCWTNKEKFEELYRHE